MGLDTSHDCWHGAYSSFNRWRNAVAVAAGVPLQLMYGFCGEEDIARMPEGVRKFLPIPWESLKPDPIHTLLNHSDCDGEIAASDCVPIAERLEAIIPLLPPGSDTFRDPRDDAETFAAGLRRAAANEPVDFH